MTQVIARADLVYLFCRASSLTLRSTCYFVGIYMLALVGQLYPWYTETDDEGNNYTVNSFDAAYTIPGYIYILLVSIQCVRWCVPDQCVFCSLQWVMACVALCTSIMFKCAHAHE